MNPVRIGRFIEDHIKARYYLEESDKGFDGYFNGMEIEIKGCIPVHKNGVNPNGRDRITKGRFWIDNRAHKNLLDEKGLYVFILYTRRHNSIDIIRVANKFAFEVNYMIGKGDNTKISYDRIFPDYRGEAIL